MKNCAVELIENGYAKLKLENSDANCVSKVFDAAGEFFNQQRSDKIAYKFKSDVEGYRELGAEFSISEDRPDLNEAFGLTIGNVSETEKLGWAENNELYRVLRSVAQLYQPMFDEFFEALRAEFARNGDRLIVGQTSYLQVNYYRPMAEQRDFLRDHHEDGHLVTVVKALEPGLEIRPTDDFEPVVLERDEVLLMPGSLLSIMTGDKIPALWHRVRNTKLEADRVSLMFFVNPPLHQPPKAWRPSASGHYKDIAEACLERSVAFGLESISKAI